jgi:amino acid transporter
MDSTTSTLSADGLKRDVGFWGLAWASEGSIIGSGWLFAGLLATSIAGPAALISWGIASVIVILLALVHAELGGMFPVTGGTSRFPHYAYGSFAGLTYGWFAYLQAASVAPIEVLATIQYTSTASWASSWYKPATNTLSGAGIAVAVILMIAFVIVNLIGIRWLAHTNTTMTTWKVIVPVVAVIVLCIANFHGGNFKAGGGFFVPGKSGGMHAVLDAVANAGIVFSLLGFEQAVQLGGEARNPQRDLPRAVITAILVGAVIYIAAQFAFIVALNPPTLTSFHGWTGLESDPALAAAPFYTVAKVAGIAWLAWVFRIDAVISPAGTGLIYLTSASRISFGLSKNGYVPVAFEKVNDRTKIPVFSVLVTAVIGLLFLLPFPSWSKLVGIVTAASVIMYSSAPLALGAFRKSHPNMRRTYLLPGAEFLTPLSFVFASWVVYWAGWGTYTTVMFALIIGYILMFLSRATNANPHQPKIDWGAAKWVLSYFIGMGIISYFGSFGSGPIMGGIRGFQTVWIGGNGRLGLYWDLLVVAVFSLGIYYWAIASRLSTPEMDEYIGSVVVVDEHA